MKSYSVKKLAAIAGVSIRTLHYYDRIGLLKPAVRTEANYRLYGEAELFRLQQILFYKELDFSLTDIRDLLDHPDFDLKTALNNHRLALQLRRERISTLLATIDKTIEKLNGTVMITDDELYAGFSPEQATAYRREAADKYGSDTIASSETHLKQQGNPQFEQLKAEQQHIAETLFLLKDTDPTSEVVQAQIGRHYANIRAFWGPAVSAKNVSAAYRGLAQLYLDDPRYTSQAGDAQPAYTAFLRAAMNHFADIHWPA